MSMKTLVVAVLLVAAAAAGALLQRRFDAPSPSSAAHDCAHHLAGDQCPFCHPDLVEAGGPCVEHGVPEALCWLCNPRLVPAFQSQGDWCPEHATPESLCALCKPAATDSPAPAPQTTLEPLETPRYLRTANVQCANNTLLVRLASAQIAHRSGIEVAPIERRSVRRTLACNMEVAYDATRYARVCARIPGVVRDVHRDVGAIVAQGDTLATIDSAELAAAKADYLQSFASVDLYDKNVARIRGLSDQGITPRKELLESENRLAEQRVALARARQRLRILGMTDDQITACADATDTNSLWPLVAPRSGIVVERNTVPGESVDTTRTLLEVADTSRMWALIDVRESDISQLRSGLSVVVTVDALPGESFAGQITWLPTRLDSHTRTLRARADIPNLAGLLRAGMLGRAEILIHDRESRLLLPKSALQWDGCCNLAFVRRAETVYEPRKLRLGPAIGDFYEILEGLSEGESVVTQGSYLLRTEILKGSIGAGCCEPVGKKN